MRLILILFITCFVNVFVFGQGYKSSKAEFENLPKASTEKFGFATSLPGSYSLRRYAPKPSFQEGSTCVGWSIAYSAMSIMYNKAMGITNDDLKFILAFDPIFTYALAQPKNRTDCEAGTSFPIALEQLLEYGAKRGIMPPIFMNCSESVFEYNNAFSSAFKPNSIYGVDFNKFSNNKESIDFLKKLIAGGSPLPFGMNTMTSMVGTAKNSSLNQGLWQPMPNDTSEGGHAMTVIGYSDYKFGGAFEIMNSWGSDYGDNGFFWIKYSDFMKYVDEVALIEPGEINAAPCIIGDCKAGYSSSKFVGGDFYEGWILDGNYAIYGVYAWEDGTIYAGDWSKGKRHGKGIVFLNGKMIGVVYNNDELVESEILGFAATKGSEQTQMLEKVLLKNNMKIENTLTAEDADLINSKIVLSK